MPRRLARPPRPGALTDFPPLKILRQIFVLQALYYICAFILISFTTYVAGRQFGVDLIWSWRSLRGDNTFGWTLGLVWMVNSFAGVLFLLIFVSRSKLIPDFALTIHFLHLLFTMLYSRSIPQTWLWWSLQFSSASFMTVLGVWGCRKRELQPISFGGGKTNGNGHISKAEYEMVAQSEAEASKQEV